MCPNLASNLALYSYIYSFPKIIGVPPCRLSLQPHIRGTITHSNKGPYGITSCIIIVILMSRQSFGYFTFQIQLLVIDRQFL